MASTLLPLRPRIIFLIVFIVRLFSSEPVALSKTITERKSNWITNPLVELGNKTSNPLHSPDAENSLQESVVYRHSSLLLARSGLPNVTDVHHLGIRKRRDNTGGGSTQTDQQPTLFLLNSEINIHSTSAKSGIFFEIYAYTNLFKHESRDLIRDLNGYRILLVRGNPLEVILSVRLSDHIKDMKGKQYIVIGTSDVPNVDVRLENCESVFSNPDISWPTFDESPYGLIVTYTSDPAMMDDLDLPQNGNKFHPLPLRLDHWRRYLISYAAVDLTVFGKNPKTNQCSYFSEMFPAYSMDEKRKYVLRDYDGDAESRTDRSLNRCCVGSDEEVPFTPYCWKIGSPTPGRHNVCSGPRFVWEEILDQIAPYDKEAVETNPSNDGCEVDYPNLSVYRYVAAAKEAYTRKLEEAFARTRTCGPSASLQGESGSEEEPMEVEEVEKTDYIDVKEYKFPQDQFDSCTHHFTDAANLLQGTAKSWLNLDQNCRVSCHACREFFRAGWRPDFKRKTYMQQDSGFLSPKKGVNSDHVRYHPDHELHREAMSYFNKMKNAATPKQKLQVWQQQQSREKALLQPTTNAIKLAYTELSVGVSFKQHGEVVDTVSSLGVRLGDKHRNEKSLKNMMTSIATSFHLKLLRHLVKENKPFTVIADCTTYSNSPVMVILFQSVEDYRPIVYLYGFIPLTEGEVSKKMVGDLIKRIEEDDRNVPGFENFFKENCVGISSDQASNMIGSKNSFYTHLQDYVGKKLAVTKCASHRLERAIIHALDFVTDSKGSKYFKTFGKINNQIFTFYQSRGNKRFRDITLLAEELNLPLYRIKYFWDIRWAASHRKCVATLAKNYEVIKADLLARASDDSYDTDGQNKATELYNQIADRAFPLVLAEFNDFLGVFEGMSKTFQKEGGLLIGNVETVRKGFVRLLELRQDVGDEVRTFLEKCSCAGVCNQGTCTLQQYDECPEVYLNGYPLHQIGPESIKLGLLRKTLYNNLLAQLQEYFEPIVLESFELFNPKYFNFRCETSCNEISHCYYPIPTVNPLINGIGAQDKFYKVCKFFGMTKATCTPFLRDWKQFLSEIVSKKALAEHQGLSPAVFWAAALQFRSITIPSRVKELFGRVLCTTFSSASAERAFSLVTQIRRPERSNLLFDSLENLLRIKFNGPRRLGDDAAYEYTREFLKTYSRVDDDTIKGGRRPGLQDSDGAYSRSRIF